MTLQELHAIKEALKNPSCECINCVDYRKQAKKLIEREIKLKTMDPRK